MTSLSLRYGFPMQKALWSYAKTGNLTVYKTKPKQEGDNNSSVIPLRIRKLKKVFRINLKSSLFGPAHRRSWQRQFRISFSNFLSYSNPRDFHIPHCRRPRRHHPPSHGCSAAFFSYYNRWSGWQFHSRQNVPPPLYIANRCHMEAVFRRSRMCRRCSPFQVETWTAV